MHHAQLVEERRRCQCQRHRYHYLPCDCSRHFSQCTHGISDTAKGNHTSEQCMNKYRHGCLTIWLHPALFSIHTWQLGHCGTEEKKRDNNFKKQSKHTDNYCKTTLIVSCSIGSMSSPKCLTSCPPQCLCSQL